MSRDAVIAIKEAEGKAAALRRGAAEKARLMAAEAKEAGENICLITERDTRAEHKAMLSEMKTKATGLIERSRNEATEEAAAMAAAAESKKVIAAKLIIRRLVEKCQ